MALQYTGKIVNDGLVMSLDVSQNTSLPTYDLPVKNNLLLWLDAADDSTFSYSSGTEVSQWRDKSGNNNHANQSTVAQQPSRSNAVNSRKTVNFVAANGDFIRVSNGIVTPNYITVFAVIKPGTQSNAYAIILEQDHGNGYNGWVIQRNNTASQWLSWVSGNGVTWLNPNYIGYTDNTPQIVTLRKNSSTLNLYSNATTNGAVSISDNPITQSSYGINLGYWQYGGGRYYNGEICEILVYNIGLSDIELNRVNTYLGIKWGVSNVDRSIFDLSRNNNNGLLGDGNVANIPVFDYYNKGSLKFDGSNDYLSVTRTLSTPLTISGFIKYIDQSKSYNTFINGRPHPTLAISLNRNGAGNLQVFIGNGVAWLGTPSINSSATLTADTWYHITFTCDGITSILYLNGVNVGTSSNIPSGFGSYFYFGHLTDNASSSEYLKGNIASVQIYTIALSAAQVSQNYNVQKSKFDNAIVQQGLVLNLDAGNPYSYAGAGTTWYDTSGAVNDFISVNSPTYSSNEFILNGSTQYFYISAASGFFISSTNNFYADVGYAWSISVWFKFPVSPTTVRNSTVNAGNCSYSMIGNAGGIGGAETLSLFVSGGDSSTSAGSLAPYYCVVGVRGSKTQLSAGSVNTNTWNHVVVTWNGSAGRGYFNGVDKGALNIGANGIQVSGYTVGATAGGASSHVFEGSLSQVFVYNRAISAAEVLQNYNATKGRFGL